MKKKKSKAFIITRVKEKLIFVPQKRFSGKKIGGVFSLVIGTVVLTASFYHYYLLPIFSARNFCPPVLPEVLPGRSPERLIVPSINLNLPIGDEKIPTESGRLSSSFLYYLPLGVDLNRYEGLEIVGSSQSKVFGRAGQIKEGDLLYLLDKERFLTFEVTGIKTGTNSDLQPFLKEGEGSLFLVSTNDYLNGKNIVIKAKLRE